MNLCVKCGATLKDGAQFCSSCGTATLTAAGEARPAEQPEMPTMPAEPLALSMEVSRSKGLAIAAIVCVSVVWIITINQMTLDQFYWSLNGSLLFLLRSITHVGSILLAVFSLYLNRNKPALIAGIIVAANQAFWFLRSLFFLLREIF